MIRHNTVRIDFHRPLLPSLLNTLSTFLYVDLFQNAFSIDSPDDYMIKIRRRFLLPFLGNSSLRSVNFKLKIENK